MVLIFAGQLCIGQTLKTTLQPLAIIGTKQIGDQVLLVTKNEKESIKITAIDAKANVSWEKIISVPALKGYSFNQCKIINTNNKVCVIQQTPQRVYWTTFNMANGEITESGETKRKNSTAEDNVWILTEDTPKMYTTQDGSLLSHHYSENNATTTRVADLPNKYPSNKYKVHFSKGQSTFATSRVLEPNHGLMHLYLQKYDAAHRDTIQKSIDLELAHTSFTYNSSVDKSVFGVVPSATGFYLVGKLDMAFKNKYPTQKVGDNCIGFWIAKFNDDLTLSYFSEIPFQYLDHIVDADVVQIPSVIDIKEDANGGLFININEQQGVIYHKKYFVYLDKSGDIKMAKGGLDAYHFMEYDRTGLRNAGRKSKIRVMNDDWSPYATNMFLYLTQKEEYSEKANTLISINEREKKATLAEKAYTFYTLPSGTLYFEYFEKGKGTLNIYTH